MSLGRNLFLIAIAAVLAAMVVFAYLKFATTPRGPAGRPDRAVPVVVATVRYDQFVDRIEAVGTAKSNESVTITAKVTETVSKVSFEDGQIVQEGDTLVELTDQEESATLAEAHAGLREAQQEYERTVDLVRRGNAAESRLETALAARDRAQARISAIEARLADRLIKAPFAGLLGLRTVSVGTLVTPGVAITTLDDISTIKLDFDVPEGFLPALAVGQDVEAKATAYPGKVFTGKVAVVDTRIDPNTRSFTVRAELPNPDTLLRPGMLLTVEVIKDRRRSLMVPEAAIVPLDTRAFVYRVNAEQKVERVQIKTGARRPGRVEVLAGVAEGDRVIIQGTNRVRPGNSVILSESADRPGGNPPPSGGGAEGG